MFLIWPAPIRSTCTSKAFWRRPARPDDGAIFADYKTEWIILGIMHGHQDVADSGSQPAPRPRRHQCRRPATPCCRFRKSPRTTSILFHTHGDEATFPVSAILVVPHDTKSATILRGRYEDPKATVQLLVPKQVDLRDARSGLSREAFFRRQALLVGGAMALLLALVVLLSLRLRRGEMETMFKIGCARWMIFGMQAAEIVIVVAAASPLRPGWPGSSLADLASPAAGHAPPAATSGALPPRRAPRNRAWRSSIIRCGISPSALPATASRSSSPFPE